MMVMIVMMVMMLTVGMDDDGGVMGSHTHTYLHTHAHARTRTHTPAPRPVQPAQPELAAVARSLVADRAGQSAHNDYRLAEIL